MLILALSLWAYVTLWFVISLIVKRNDVADIAWGLGFVLMIWGAFLLHPVFTIGRALLILFITVWGLRLSIHIFQRNIKKPEDERYAVWRREWGTSFLLRSYGQVFLLQGLFLWIISLAAVVYLLSFTDDSVFTYVGAAIWIVGFVFEAVGDRQLRTFLKAPKNKGKVMKSGLWQFTRHPNYFGEATMWWGIWLMTFGVSWWWALIVSPLLITFLLVKVSGVPMLEKRYAGNPEYEEYKKVTSMFFPLPPNKKV